MAILRSYLPWAHLLDTYSTWYMYPATSSLTDAIRDLGGRYSSVVPLPLLQGYSNLQAGLRECRGKKGRPYFRGSVFILLQEPSEGTVFHATAEMYLREFTKSKGVVYAWDEFHDDVLRLDFKKYFQSKVDFVI